jgi:hypothetical protein
MDANYVLFMNGQSAAARRAVGAGGGLPRAGALDALPKKYDIDYHLAVC